MDNKKYKHIKLPSALNGPIADYSPKKQGRPEDLPGFGDKSSYKLHLENSSNEVRAFATQSSSARRIEKDKTLVDFKLKVQGRLYDKIFTKYNLKVSTRYDDREVGQDYSNDTIIARVSNSKLPDKICPTLKDLRLI